MSEVNPFPIVNYLDVAKERSTVQWEDKPVFQKYLKWLFSSLQELQLTLRDLKQLRSIDTATGEQLDIIGRIVGQPREIIDSDMLKFFGFELHPVAESYGDLSKPAVGGVYRGLETPTTGNVLLNDDQYRLFIKAKIVRNTTHTTPDEFLRFLEFVFGAKYNNMIGEDTASFVILVGKDLSSFEIQLLTYESVNDWGETIRFIPKPLGVNVTYGYFPENPFGFEGVPSSGGYGNLVYVDDIYILESGVGGRYASLITS